MALHLANSVEEKHLPMPNKENQPSFLRALFFAIFFVSLFIGISLQFNELSGQTSNPTPTPSPDCSTTPTATPSATQIPYDCGNCVSPSPTPYPSPSPWPPSVKAIPAHWQDDQHAPLTWQVYTPTPAPASSPPGIVLIHGSFWNAGSSLQIQGKAQDLARQGYYVVSVNPELAPCGLIPGQQCHELDGQDPGWWVRRQVEDVEAFITAFRDSGKVDPNKIGLVGGSSGATLAALVAFDTTDTGSNWPYWNSDTRPACVVLLSGTYDFADRAPPVGETSMDPQAIKYIENFTQTGDPTEQNDLSPVTKLAELNMANDPFVPMFLVHGEREPGIPLHQLDDMICAIEAKGVDPSLYEYLVIWHSALHSFAYWDSCDELPFTVDCTLVQDDVVAFLDAHLK
jgi:acetyl esterase/lipase